MPRRRVIRPEAFRSLSLAGVDVEARWLFAGLWTEADDEGRVVDHPAFVRSAVFPMDAGITDADVVRWIDQLAVVDSICRYEVDGKRYLHVPAWRDHQQINRPSPPRHPPCPVHGGASVPGEPVGPPVPDQDVSALVEVFRDAAAEAGVSTHYSVLWREPFTLLLRAGHSVPELSAAITWGFSHSFWRLHLSSPAKFRRSLGTITAQMDAEASAARHPARRSTAARLAALTGESR